MPPPRTLVADLSLAPLALASLAAPTCTGLSYLTSDPEPLSGAIAALRNVDQQRLPRGVLRTSRQRAETKEKVWPRCWSWPLIQTGRERGARLSTHAVHALPCE